MYFLTIWQDLSTTWQLYHLIYIYICLSTLIVSRIIGLLLAPNLTSGYDQGIPQELLCLIDVFDDLSIGMEAKELAGLIIRVRFNTLEVFLMGSNLRHLELLESTELEVIGKHSL